MPAKTAYSADLPNGTIIRRASERTYTHALTVETTYSDGTVCYRKAEWAGSPALAEKGLSRLRALAARDAGTEVMVWDEVNRKPVGTGTFRQSVVAMAIPVNR